MFDIDTWNYAMLEISLLVSKSQQAVRPQAQSQKTKSSIMEHKRICLEKILKLLGALVAGNGSPLRATLPQIQSPPGFSAAGLLCKVRRI